MSLIPWYEKMLKGLKADLSAGPIGAVFIANIPGLQLSSSMCLARNTYLLHAAPEKDSISKQSEIISRGFLKEAGVQTPFNIMSRGNPLTLATLVKWSDDRDADESEALRLPLVAINLLLDSPRPVLVSEVLEARREDPDDADKRAVQSFHRMQSESPVLLVPTGPILSHERNRTLEQRISALMSSIGKVETQDVSLRSAIDLLVSGDAKWGLPDQLRTRVIEYAVALESLLLENEPELAYRFALRMCTLIHPIGDRLDTFQSARSIYRLRSTAVHAGKPAGALNDKHASTIRLHLRLCIFRYLSLLEQGFTKKDVLDMLDRALLRPDDALKLHDFVGRTELWPVESLEVES